MYTIIWIEITFKNELLFSLEAFMLLEVLR